MDKHANEYLVRLFAEEIPEIAAGLVEIKAVARLPGVRSKLALRGRSPDVDAVGVCVGERGCRVKRICDRLGGERIELFRWHDSPEELIANALQPACIRKVVLDPARHRATVTVDPDSLSFVTGTGRAGYGDDNRELASRLCGWLIDVIAG